MIEPLYKEEIKKVLFSLKAKKGILLTDHYYQDVLDIADKNAVLTKGELHAVNTKEDLQKLGYLRWKHLKNCNILIKCILIWCAFGEKHT